jgi:NADPH-dependent curcumin reductase
MTNKRLILVSRPFGVPKECNFSVEENNVPNLNEGEILVKSQFLSIDSGMRGWMGEGKSYIPSIPLGGNVWAIGVGKVVDSKSCDYEVGDYIYTGAIGVQNYSKFYAHKNGADVGGLKNLIEKFDPKLISPPTYLATLGMSGMTAYFGLLDIGNIKSGDTVVVSGAGGGVGIIAGQIAKIKGCKVIGITSSDEKGQNIVDNFNFDYFVNYKSPNWRDQLLAICPDGVDVFFDNVGGDVLNILLTCLREGARVVLCGAASQYNSNPLFLKGPVNYMSLVVKRAKMQGFIWHDYSDRFQEAREDISQWIKQGKLNANPHVVKGGVENFLQVFSGMFAGQNTGKMILELDN